jgi:hypothetical protein
MFISLITHNFFFWTCSNFLSMRRSLFLQSGCGRACSAARSTGVPGPREAQNRAKGKRAGTSTILAVVDEHALQPEVQEYMGQGKPKTEQKVLRSFWRYCNRILKGDQRRVNLIHCHYIIRNITCGMWVFFNLPIFSAIYRTVEDIICT